MRRPQDFSIDAGIAPTLRCWLRSTALPQGQITRAKIILGLHAGKTPSEIAQGQLVSCKTMHKWRNRFIGSRVDGLRDEQRPGRPPTLDLPITGVSFTGMAQRCDNGEEYGEQQVVAGMVVWILLAEE